jgi:hypothetical protein
MYFLGQTRQFRILDDVTAALHTNRERKQKSVQNTRKEHMEPAQYDILRREKNKAAIWLETSADLTTARFRIKQIISFWPGTYQVVERDSQRIVAAVGSGARLGVPLRRTREYVRKCFRRSHAWLLAPSPRIVDLARHKDLQNYARDCFRTGREWLCAPLVRIQTHRSR